MIKEIIMPKLGETMEEGYLVSWKKEEGEKVEKGEVLFEVMSDKTNFEIESPYAGYLRKKLFQASDDPIPVTTVIGYISDTPDEPLPEEEEKKVEEEKEPEKKEKKEVKKEEAEKEEKKEEEERIKATPLAKKIAKEKGVNLSEVKGTGPGGRIEKKDVEEYLSKGETAGVVKEGEYEVKKWSPMRKVIAKRLSESKREIPHYYLEGKFIVDQISSLKEILKKEGKNFSYTDFLIFFAARAIEKYPLINAATEKEEIKIYKSIDIGVAVAIEDGLVVPVVRNAGKKNLEEISKERISIVEKARSNKLTDSDIKGGRFVISNLGMYGVDNFQPIINPPGVAIMGVGKIGKEVIAVNDRIEIKTVMNVSFSFDHRVIDGGYAGLFYSYFKQIVENPGLLIL